ncbi:MAG: hypothetical protein GY814_16840 [Gammaproteobacteria bacterium]|nr:hypothetical protein [Gammaproteobacteria bacterium]
MHEVTLGTFTNNFDNLVAELDKRKAFEEFAYYENGQIEGSSAAAFNPPENSQLASLQTDEEGLSALTDEEVLNILDSDYDVEGLSEKDVDNLLLKMDKVVAEAEKRGLNGGPIKEMSEEEISRLGKERFRLEQNVAYGKDRSSRDGGKYLKKAQAELAEFDSNQFEEHKDAILTAQRTWQNKNAEKYNSGGNNLLYTPSPSETSEIHRKFSKQLEGMDREKKEKAKFRKELKLKRFKAAQSKGEDTAISEKAAGYMMVELGMINEALAKEDKSKTDHKGTPEETAENGYNTVGQTDKITDKVVNDSFENRKEITSELNDSIVEGLNRFASDMEGEKNIPAPKREDYKNSQEFRKDFNAHRADTRLYRTVKKIIKDSEKGLISALIKASKKGDVATLLHELNEDPIANLYGFNEKFEELKDSQLDFGQTDMFLQNRGPDKNKTDHKGTLSLDRKPSNPSTSIIGGRGSRSGQDKNLVGKSEERDVNELLGIAKEVAEERGRKAEESILPKRSNTRSSFSPEEIANSIAPAFDNIDDEAHNSNDEDTRDFRTSATREESDVYLGRQTRRYEKGEVVEQKDKMGRLRRHRLSHDDIKNLSGKNARRQGYSSREEAEKFAQKQIREGKNYPEYADIKDDPDAIKVIKKKGRYFIKISPKPEAFSPGSKISAFDVRMDDDKLFDVAVKQAHIKYKNVKKAVENLNKTQTRNGESPGYNRRALIKAKNGYIGLPYLVSLMRSYKQTSSTEKGSRLKKLREDVLNTLSYLAITDTITDQERARIFDKDSHDGLSNYGRNIQVGLKTKVKDGEETTSIVTISNVLRDGQERDNGKSIINEIQFFTASEGKNLKNEIADNETAWVPLKDKQERAGFAEKLEQKKAKGLVEDEVGAYSQEEILPTSTEIGIPHKEKQYQIAEKEMNTLEKEGDRKKALKKKVERNSIKKTLSVDPSTKESLSEKDVTDIKRSNGDESTIYDLTKKSKVIQTDKERLEKADERAAKHEAHKVKDEESLKRIVKGITGRQNLTVSDKGFSPRDKNFMRVALETVPELKKVKLLVMTKSDFMGTAYFKDHKFTPMAIKRARKFLKDNPEVRGQTIPVGDSAIIIVEDIPTPATNQAHGERLLVLGHELGHVVFNQVKGNLTAGQQARLTKMHRESKSELDQEEWFSDQVSALVKDRASKPNQKGVIAETAQKIINSLNKLWKALSKAMQSRFTLDENFDKWMTRSVLPNPDMFSDNIGYDYTREFTMDKPKRAIGKAIRTLKKVFGHDLAPMYLTAHRQLRNMGPSGEMLARMFHVESGKGAGRLGWLDVKDTESAYRSKRFMDLLPENHEEFLRGYTDMITAKEESLTDDFRDAVFNQYKGVGNKTVYGLDILKGIVDPKKGAKGTALWNVVSEAIPGKTHAEKVAFAKEYLRVPAEYQAFDNEMRNHYKYLNRSMGGKMAKMQYFFPRMYDVDALMKNKKGFIEILTDNAYVVVNKDGEKEPIDNSKAEGIWKALTSNEGMDAEGFFVDQGLKTPSLDNKKHRTLRDIPDNVLREFLIQDDIRLMKYISASTKRAEYESRAGGMTNIQDLLKKMKKQIAQGREIDPEIYANVYKLAKEDQRKWAEYETKKAQGEKVNPPKRKQYWDPNHKADALVQALPEEHRARARLVMDAYLGRLGLDMNPDLDKTQQKMAALQLMTTLLFATLASLQDVAGIAIKTREWGGIKKVAGHMYKSIKNRAEYDQMARTLGVVQDETVGKILAELYGMNYIDPKVQKVTDAYFKYTGLEWFTKMTRTVAVAVGKDFIRDHMGRIIADGNETSRGYMEALGLDPDRPTIPKDEDFINNTRLRQGLSKFVDDSILRPNAAQRPVWGSDKRFMLVWQLKSFFYGFGHTILGGIFREAKRVYGNEQGMNKIKAAFPFILAAATLFPIAMLGLELREIVKYGFGPAPTDRMDTDAYFTEIFERAGGLGPLTLVAGMFSASQYGGSPVNALLGPTAQHVELLLKDFGAGLERAIPVHSQLKDRMFGFDYNPMR